MTGLNRGRYTVHLGGNWRLYSASAPDGWIVHGVIDRGGQKGLLVESPASILCQLNAGTIRSLDQRKARSALQAALDGNTN